MAGMADVVNPEVDYSTPVPPQNPQELQQRVSGWMALAEKLRNDPQTSLDLAARFAAGPQAGQSTFAHLTGAASGGMKAYKAREAEAAAAALKAQQAKSTMDLQAQQLAASKAGQAQTEVETEMMPGIEMARREEAKVRTAAEAKRAAKADRSPQEAAYATWKAIKKASTEGSKMTEAQLADAYLKEQKQQNLGAEMQQRQLEAKYWEKEFEDAVKPEDKARIRRNWKAALEGKPTPVPEEVVPEAAPKPEEPGMLSKIGKALTTPTAGQATPVKSLEEAKGLPAGTKYTFEGKTYTRGKTQ